MSETYLTVNTLFQQNAWRKKQPSICSFFQPRLPPPPPPTPVPFPSWSFIRSPLCCPLPLQCLWISAPALWWGVAMGMKHSVGAESVKTKRGASISVTHISNRVSVPLPQGQWRLSQEHRLLPLSPGNKTAAHPTPVHPASTPITTRVSAETPWRASTSWWYRVSPPVPCLLLRHS